MIKIPDIPPPKNLNQVFATQRSGHHAVMSWMEHGYKAQGRSTFHQNDAYHGHLGNKYAHVADPSAQEVLGKTAASVVFINYEDVRYEQRNTVPVYTDLRASGHLSQDMVVIRDWYGMLASRTNSIAKAEKSGNPLQLHDMPWDEVAATWLDHATTAVEGNAPAISFNQWFLSNEYRKQVAKEFDIANTDNSLGKVPEFGNGSSFSGQAFDGSAREMNVLRRWEDLPVDQLDRYHDIATSYPAIDKLNRELFGFGSAEVTLSIARRLKD